MKLINIEIQKIHITLILIFALITLIYNGSFAEDDFSQTSQLSLKELVNKALENNYQIKIIKNVEKKSVNSNTLGNAGFYPVLSLSAGASSSANNTKQTLYTGEERNNPNATSNNLNASLTADWTLFDGLQMFAMKNKLGYLENLGAINTRYYIEETIFSLALAYFQLVKENDKLKILQETKKFSKDRLDLEKKKFEIGKTSILEQQQAEYDFNQDSISYLQQVITIKSLVSQINTAINSETNSYFYPMDSLAFDGKLDLQALQKLTFDKNLDLSMDKIKKLITQEEINIIKSSFYPQLDVFASYNYQSQNNNASIYKSNQLNGVTYGLTFSFNLYNGEKTTIAYQNAKIDAENAEFSISDKKNQLSKTLDDLFSQYVALKKIYEILKSNVKLSANSLNIAEQKLLEGSINGFDFRQVQLNYLNAQNAVTNITYAIKINELELQKLAGGLTEYILNN